MEEEVDGSQLLWDCSEALSPSHLDKDVLWRRSDSDFEDFDYSEGVEACPLCQQRRCGYLRQPPYATCWQCWTLASYRFWWELAETLPEPAVALAHCFLFGEWSVRHLGFLAEDPVAIDLQLLERAPPSDSLMQTLTKLTQLRPVRFVSLWPSSQLYQILRTWPAFRRGTWRELVVWEGGALASKAPSLLSALGLQGLASLTQRVKQALASQHLLLIRLVQGKASLVGEICWPAPLPALQTIVDEFQDRLVLTWTSGRIFRIGTLPSERLKTSVWFTSAAGGLHTEPTVVCSSAASMVRELQRRFPL